MLAGNLLQSLIHLLLLDATLDSPLSPKVAISVHFCTDSLWLIYVFIYL